MSAAAPRKTGVFFPPMYRVLLTTSKVEIGGVLLFEKRNEPERLFCNSIMTTLGDNTAVHLSAILDRFHEQSAWTLFHTHPTRDVNKYQFLSGGDLTFMLYNALTQQYSDEDVPSVSHLLITDQYALFTKLGKHAFQYQFRLMNAFKLDNRDITDQTMINEYLIGMSKLFAAYELYFLHTLTTDSRSKEAVQRGDCKDLATCELIFIDDFLDECQFSPDDPKTQVLLSGIPLGQSKYIDWMKGKVASKADMPGKAVIPEGTVLSDTKGLFYSWHTPMDLFKGRFEEPERGITIDDGGGLYDLVENWDVRRSGPPVVAVHPAAQVDVMQVSTSPPRAPSMSAPRGFVTPPRAGPVGQVTPSRVAQLLRMSDTPPPSPSRMRAGTRRKKHRRPRTYRRRA